MYIETYADFFIKKFTEKYEIEKVFVYPGGTIAPLVNSALKAGLSVETFKTEQGAGYAAISYGFAVGSPQLLLVTSGPGVTNAISCVCDAYFDSIPLVMVSGQIGTAELLSGRDVRQIGFQQVDGASMLKNVTKYSECFTEASDFKKLDEIFDLAQHQRGGPVYLELPMDLQRSEFLGFSELTAKSKLKSPPILNPNELHDSLAIIKESLVKSRKPLALIGAGGLSSAQAQQSLNRLIRQLNLHFVTSLRGVGFSSYKDPLNLGYLGHTGHERANSAVFHSDFLLVLGSRLDVRQTGTQTEAFSKDKKIFSINNDLRELEATRVEINIGLLSDVTSFSNSFLSYLKDYKISGKQKWWAEISDYRKREKNDLYKDGLVFTGRGLVETVSSIVSEKTVAVVTGVGCHQHWVARHFDFQFPSKRLFTSSGHGTMGFDVPAAVGVAMSGEFSLTICFVGDGSIMHNICELRSAVDRGLNVLFVVFQNKRLGIVSQFQKITFGDDPTTSNFDTGDLCSIATGFGLYSMKIKYNDIENFEFLINSVQGPRMAVVEISQEEDISPMLLGGSQLNDLWKLEL
ncbi:thiamine pyrophosphate-binding protein [Paracoccaceae bacterium]|nr:thiamine pyrophosphate-binding protein [Paracoccaceae bacterium]